jgi:prephenate dehydratase
MIITHLGPSGTYTEQAALFYLQWLQNNWGIEAQLSPYPTIAQSLQAVKDHNSHIAVVPVENSIEGSVSMTMDTIWQLEKLQIRLALVLPIIHTLISAASNLGSIQKVYSHPQALAQCQTWLAQYLPNVNLIPSNSTAIALETLTLDSTAAAIASSRAAELYNLPILASGINDHPENCTRFWVISQSEDTDNFDNQQQIKDYIYANNHSHTSVAFSLPANVPGALIKSLEVFANLGINLSRIESRPTKRYLGEYLFFLDLEGDMKQPLMQRALQELSTCTEALKIFGSYNILPISA